MGLHHFAIQQADRWAVVYVVPGTGVMNVVCTCRSLESANEEAARLNGGGA